MGRAGRPKGGTATGALREQSDGIASMRMNGGGGEIFVRDGDDLLVAEISLGDFYDPDGYADGPNGVEVDHLYQQVLEECQRSLRETGELPGEIELEFIHETQTDVDAFRETPMTGSAEIGDLLPVAEGPQEVLDSLRQSGAFPDALREAIENKRSVGDLNEEDLLDLEALDQGVNLPSYHPSIGQALLEADPETREAAWQMFGTLYGGRDLESSVQKSDNPLETARAALLRERDYYRAVDRVAEESVGRSLAELDPKEKEQALSRARNEMLSIEHTRDLDGAAAALHLKGHSEEGWQPFGKLTESEKEQWTKRARRIVELHPRLRLDDQNRIVY